MSDMNASVAAVIAEMRGIAHGATRVLILRWADHLEPAFAGAGALKDLPTVWRQRALTDANAAQQLTRAAAEVESALTVGAKDDALVIKSMNQ